LFDLKDKVIILTGATGVLGSAIALSLAKAQVQLILLGRNQELLDLLNSQLTPFTKVRTFVVDVLNKQNLLGVRSKILSELNHIDILINAVGGNLPGAVIPDHKTVFDLSENDFDEVVDLNLKGTLLLQGLWSSILHLSFFPDRSHVAKHLH